MSSSEEDLSSFLKGDTKALMSGCSEGQRPNRRYRRSSTIRRASLHIELDYMNVKTKQEPEESTAVTPVATSTAAKPVATSTADAIDYSPEAAAENTAEVPPQELF